jgi:hypothetical protein
MLAEANAPHQCAAGTIQYRIFARLMAVRRLTSRVCIMGENARHEPEQELK